MKLKAAEGARFTGTLTVTGPAAPSASVTRRVTDFAPEVANVVVGDTPVASVKTPSPLKSQLYAFAGIGSSSVEVDALGVTVAPGLGRAGVNVARATGVAFASTVTLCEIAADTPSESMTWRAIVLAPAVANEVVAVMPVASSNCPSPSRSHAYEPAVSVLSSVVVAAFTDTWSPTSGLAGVMTNAGRAGCWRASRSPRSWQRRSRCPRR